MYIVQPVAAEQQAASVYTAPQARPEVSVSELGEIFTYLLRHPEFFREARSALGQVALNRPEELPFAVLWQRTLDLADRHGGGDLPANLRPMLETEVRAAAMQDTNAASGYVLDQLLGRAEPVMRMGEEPVREGGMIARIFAVDQEEVDNSVTRGRELLDRLAYERTVAAKLENYVRRLDGKVPLPEDLAAFVHDLQGRLDGQQGERDQLAMLDWATFDTMDCSEEWIVENVLVEGQPAVIGGPMKSLKTHIALDLSISVAIGGSAKFLGYFPVANQGRVGICSFESGRATLQRKGRLIAARKARRPDEVPVFWDFEIPQLGLEKDLQRLGNTIQRYKLKMIVIDPLYLTLLSGTKDVNAGNIYQMGPLLARVTSTCLEAGCTPVFVHHAGKHRGQTQDPLMLEDLSYAGAGEFARQWILLNRRAKYDPETGDSRLWMNIGGSAGQAGTYAVDVAEGKMRKNFSGQTWDVTVRTEAEEIAQKQDLKASAADAKDEKAWQKIERVLLECRDGETAEKISRLCRGVSKATVERLCEDKVCSGKLDPVEVIKGGGKSSRSYSGYRLTCWRPLIDGPTTQSDGASHTAGDASDAAPAHMVGGEAQVACGDSTAIVVSDGDDHVQEARALRERADVGVTDTHQSPVVAAADIAPSHSTMVFDTLNGTTAETDWDASSVATVEDGGLAGAPGTLGQADVAEPVRASAAPSERRAGRQARPRDFDDS